MNSKTPFDSGLKCFMFFLACLSDSSAVQRFRVADICILQILVHLDITHLSDGLYRKLSKKRQMVGTIHPDANDRAYGVSSREFFGRDDLLVSALTFTIAFSGCSNSNDSRNVIHEDMKASFEQADLLSANIGIFTKTENNGSVSYGEGGSGVIFEKQENTYYALTAALTMTEDVKTERYTAGSPCGAYIETPCKFCGLHGIRFVLFSYRHGNQQQ